MTAGSDARCHEITFGNLVKDLMSARRGVQEDLERLLKPSETGSETWDGRRVVVDEIRGDQLVHCCEVSSVDLRIELADQRLVVAQGIHDGLRCLVAQYGISWAPNRSPGWVSLDGDTAVREPCDRTLETPIPVSAFSFVQDLDVCDT